jgi:hypothetical protein
VNAVCLLIAGVLHATLPTAEFSVAWDHSVEKTRWEERYRIDGSRLELTEARVQGMGAGMEPPPDAVLESGWWRWVPRREALSELRLTFSTFTTDYRLCWNQRCDDLATVLGLRPADGEVVSVRPCAASASNRPPT